MPKSQSYLSCVMCPNQSGMALSGEARHASSGDCIVGGGGLACPRGGAAVVGGNCAAPCCAVWKML